MVDLCGDSYSFFLCLCLTYAVQAGEGVVDLCGGGEGGDGILCTVIPSAFSCFCLFLGLRFGVRLVEKGESAFRVNFRRATYRRTTGPYQARGTALSGNVRSLWVFYEYTHVS